MCALRLLSQQHTVSPSLRRGLHITGAQSAQPANVTDRATLYSARTIADLKSECQKRSLRVNGTHDEVYTPIKCPESLNLTHNAFSSSNVFPTTISSNLVPLALL
jgi:hypothetical protein